MTINQIREDLKKIKIYYSRKELFEDKEKITGPSAEIFDIVVKYDNAVLLAPDILYQLYLDMYVNNLTQQEVAEKRFYSTRYVQILHKKLLFYFQRNL